ncbi:MAG TPA: alpha/beta fold hydrolase [Candidatus Limnocylindrales bacterium]
MASADPVVDVLTVERIVAVEPLREFRLNPRDRSVACTGEVAGTRQVLVLSLRGGAPTQLTAAEAASSDPQWSPDGRRLAFVRDNGIWVLEADGSREVRVSHHPAGESQPRWSPDGHSLAFVSRRRGWSQIWVVEAPVPRRGRPRKEPRPAVPRAVTPPGMDVTRFAWSPDGRRFAVVATPSEPTSRHEISIVDIDGGQTELAGPDGAWETGVSWLSDSALLFVSDADGWFQVVRSSADGRERAYLTEGAREHGEPDGAFGLVPLVSPDGAWFTHVEIHDGLCDLMVAPIAGGPVKRGRGRPPKNPKAVSAPGGSRRVDPWDGLWRTVAWLADGQHILAIGESETRPQDLWVLPVPGLAPDDARPRQLTDSLPAVLRPALVPGRAAMGERIRVTARDGLAIEGTLWRPPAATGRRGASRVPTIVFPHGGPTSQAFRAWQPFKQLLVHDGFAFIDVDFRGSTGYGRAFREANSGEWGHADVHDVVDVARWAAAQPWSDGRLAVYGGSYGGYLVLCALVDEPSIWSAGVDLYGDSEIAESFRHGDRVGRLDLHGMMGDPDQAERAELYRRGSPLYRAERIEAPLLILHGRKDRRVVPLMSEKMVEALEIESKHHEVVWFDDEGHGWERRENRRAAFTKIREFLRTHVIDAQT